MLCALVEQIGKALEAMQGRADAFFDRELSVGNGHRLLTAPPGALRAAFEEAVVGGVEEAVAESLGEMATLLEDRSRSQARAVLDFLGRRPQSERRKGPAAGGGGGGGGGDESGGGGVDKGGSRGGGGGGGGGAAGSMLVGRLHDGHFDGVRWVEHILKHRPLFGACAPDLH